MTKRDEAIDLLSSLLGAIERRTGSTRGYEYRESSTARQFVGLIIDAAKEEMREEMRQELLEHAKRKVAAQYYAQLRDMVERGVIPKDSVTSRDVCDVRDIIEDQPPKGA